MTTRIVELRRDLLNKNDEKARALRARFRAADVLVLNLVSSPGTGKTAFLERTLRELVGRGIPVAALVGDLETDNDARRLAASGAPVRQINTHGRCHLEAEWVESHLDGWALDDLRYLFVENVGNLVCPSSYDLGEAVRVALLSVAEGEDKPLKYPGIFNSADAAVITKWDLAAPCEFAGALRFAGQMVERARKRLADASNVAIRVEDGQALQCPDNSFDAVVCSLGLMFFPDPARGLSEFHRVLRPGGYAAVSVNTVPERSYNTRINTIIAIAIPLIPTVARVIRSNVLSLREMPFVEAAKATGMSEFRIAVVHVLPNTLAPLIVLATAQLGSTILTEASLSFLGLGVPEPYPSWGRMLSESAAEYVRTAPWLVIFPGLAISLVVFGSNLMGDALRDALDPRQRD